MTRHPITIIDRIIQDHAREVEMIEQQLDAGDIDARQYDALIHGASVRKLDSLHRYADRVASADRLADVLIKRGVV